MGRPMLVCAPDYTAAAVIGRRHCRHHFAHLHYAGGHIVGFGMFREGHVFRALARKIKVMVRQDNSHAVQLVCGVHVHTP